MAQLQTISCTIELSPEFKAALDSISAQLETVNAKLDQVLAEPAKANALCISMSPKDALGALNRERDRLGRVTPEDARELLKSGGNSTQL